MLIAREKNKNKARNTEPKRSSNLHKTFVYMKEYILLETSKLGLKRLSSTLARLHTYQFNNSLNVF